MRKNTESNLLAARLSLSCCCDSRERTRSTIDERTRENKVFHIHGGNKKLTRRREEEQSESQQAGCGGGGEWRHSGTAASNQVQRKPQEMLDFASPGTVHSYNDNILFRVGSPL
jgi:hypothetical protein